MKKYFETFNTMTASANSAEASFCCNIAVILGAIIMASIFVALRLIAVVGILAVLILVLVVVRLIAGTFKPPVRACL